MFFLDYTVQLRHSYRIGTHPYNTHIGKTYPYEHLRTLNRQFLDIGEVTQASHCRWECRLPLKHNCNIPALSGPVGRVEQCWAGGTVADAVL